MNNVEIDKLNETLKEYADYATKLVKENKRKDKEIERLNNIIDELREKLVFALKCKDTELQCVFEAYEIEEMINKLELKEGKQ